MRMVKTIVGIVSLLSVTIDAVAATPRLYPLVSDWEQWFRVDAETSIRDGKSIVSGTVWNTSGWSARRIQLLIEGLDATGTPVEQRVMWLGPALPRGTHAYFEFPMPPSAAYRVSVFAFDGAPGKRH